MEIDNTERGNATVPRRQLGRFLRHQREAAGKTIRAAADYMDCSTQKIWRIEKGAVPVRGPEVKQLCEFYRTDPSITEALVGLAKGTKARGWWQSYREVVMPEWLELFIGLEAAAARIRKYEPEVVPGLLQAPAYMEAIIRIDTPHFTDADVHAGIHIKRERQALLSRHFPPPPSLEVILSEGVLLGSIDVPGAMQQQLWHLLKANQEGRANVRVLPLSAAPHRASVSGKFTILEFPALDPTDKGAHEPPTVYSDGLTGAIYLDKPHEIDAYEEVWNDIDRLALSVEGSNQAISAVLRGMSGSGKS